MSATRRFYSSSIPVPVDDLIAWYGRTGALARSTPPWLKVRVKEQQGGIAPGDTVRLRVPLAGPAGFDWLMTHEALEGSDGFADVQLSGPFASWRHEHRFSSDGEHASRLEDRLLYELPAGRAGEVLAADRIGDLLDRMFAVRHLRTRNDLIRHRQAALDQPLRIAITGASGLVGQRLIPFLQGGGHEIVRVVRREAQDASEVSWNPKTGEIEAAKLEGLDAVVHLAGVSIASGPWTRRRKQAIRDSRIQGTRLLATTLAGLDRPPKVLVSNSAVGYYGSRGDEMLDEHASSGTGFLAEVCREWEAAADPAREAGIRVVHPRFGVVFAGDGGMLPLLATVFKSALGGRLGDGQQFMSWIAAEDLIGVLLECIVNDGLEGPVNAVSPEAITNEDFTRVMGKVLHRPTIIRAPAFAMRKVAGDLANDLILTSQRVVPVRLAQAGFPFAFTSLEATLRFELGKGEPDFDENLLPLEE